MDKDSILNKLYSLKLDASIYKHYSNIQAKLNKNDTRNEEFLFKCIEKYIEYHNNFNIFNYNELTCAWNKYLYYVRTNNKVFSAQSKFESTILEESIARMFYKYMSNNIKIGSIKAYSNMFFAPSSFDDFKKDVKIKFNVKDQDFAIYKEVIINIGKHKEKVFVPVVAIECKTYLDKTMLEGSVATAEKIKNGNPYCKFYIITESYEVSTSVDIKSTRIDQIYILTKSTSRANRHSEIKQDVLERLDSDISTHLQGNWSDIDTNIKDNGIIL